MTEYEKVREAVDDAITSCIEYDAVYNNILSIDTNTAIRMILSIPELAILADDQSLPDGDETTPMDDYQYLHYLSQKQLRDEHGFRRVIQKEEK